MTGSLQSSLLVGTVRHRRLAPKRNVFRYGVYQLLLDVDELPRLDGELRGFGYNRRNLVEFRDADHLGPRDRPVREKLARWLEREGRPLEDRQVFLLTNPRVFGYVFNPVSYFYCLGRDGELDFTVAEVNNTFGETYCYVLDDREPVGGKAVRSKRTKEFHVSPFMPIEGIRYEWIVTPPGDHMTVHIDEFERGEKFFDATLSLKRKPLTGATLARALVRYPHQTARTITRIHWQAARLWLKGVPFFRKPDPPANGLEAL
ncbi:MAG: DUF1365 domain-containing protein [Gemmatimonadetes bacterium]|nr:DUF1365 domain-containing protein [Gemmatimonadota bacterium]